MFVLHSQGFVRAREDEQRVGLDVDPRALEPVAMGSKQARLHIQLPAIPSALTLMKVRDWVRFVDCSMFMCVYLVV